MTTTTTTTGEAVTTTDITTTSSTTTKHDLVDQLLLKLGSLYVHKMYHEQLYNIYNNNSNSSGTSSSSSSNNNNFYDTYHKYCTYKLKRLRHTNYKMTPPPSISVENDDTAVSTTTANNVLATTTTTTTTPSMMTVKALLVHNTKYANTVTPIIGSPSETATTTISTTTTVTTKVGKGENANSTNNKKKGKGKHTYQSRKVIYDNILHHSSKDETAVVITSGKEEKDDTDTDAITDIEYYNYHPNIIWNLYYQAERAWAVAMSLLIQNHSSSVHNESSSSVLLMGSKYVPANKPKKCSHHHHVQNRLNKAVYWSKLLYNTVHALVHMETTTTTTTTDHSLVSTNFQQMKQSFVQECFAYMKWMEGNAALEHKSYTLAYSSYSESVRTIYQLTLLLQIVEQNPIEGSLNSTAMLQQKELYSTYCTKWKMYIDNILRPLVRYCQYEIKDNVDSNNAEDILAIIDQQNNTTLANRSISSSSSGVTKVRFRNIDITFDHQIFSQQIIVAYIKLEPQLLLIKNDDTKSSKITNDEGICLQIMSDLDDLMVLVLKEYKTKHPNNTDNGTGSSTNTASASQLIAFYAYLKYYKLSIWRQQQEDRIHSIVLQQQDQNQRYGTFLTDVIRLYTTLQQIVVAMLELSPPSMTVSSTTQSNDEDDPYMLEAQAHIVRVRAFRCYYMALYYEMIEEQEQTDSSKNGARILLHHTQLLTKRAIEEISACEDDSTILLSSKLIDKYINELEELQDSHLKALVCRFQVTSFMQQVFDESSDPSITSNRSSTDKKNAWLSPPPTSLVPNPNRPLYLRYADKKFDDNDHNNIIPFVDVPPKPIPIPCKGIFYDIASQYIDELIFNEVVQVLQNDYFLKELNQQQSNAVTSNESVGSPNYNVLQWFTTSKK